MAIFLPIHSNSCMKYGLGIFTVSFWSVFADQNFATKRNHRQPFQTITKERISTTLSNFLKLANRSLGGDTRWPNMGVGPSTNPIPKNIYRAPES